MDKISARARLGRTLSAAAMILLAAPLAAQPAQRPAPAPAPPAVVVPQTLPTLVAPVFSRVPENPVPTAALPPPRRFVTQREIRIRGQRVRYTATAGESYITNLYGHPIASFFSFAYVKDGPRDPSRPVMFVFNGGPGSASLWIHMGAIGPRRLVLDQEVNPSVTPPFGLQDNPNSILDVADLVFIDPVGTGYSQAIGNAVNADFFGIDEDAESVARFIEAWITENGRWNSPKYLMGESYGSVRAAILPRTLMGGPLYSGVMRGITVDGIVLLGVALGIYDQPQPPTGPDPRAGLFLPGFATTAWYHNRVDRAGRSVEQVYEEARRFGETDYAAAVHRLGAGDLPEAEKQAVAARLAALTGVPAEAWIRSNLRLSNQAFLRALLAEQGLEAGNYDSRYTLPLTPTGNDPVADDPAMGRYVPGFISAFHDMIRDDLNVRMPMPYNAITWVGLNFAWRRERFGVPVAPTVAGELAVSMRRNQNLRLLVASGYYDMVTTAASAESQVRRAGLPADRVTIRNYESGHMLYLGDTAEAFSNDVRALIAGGN